MLFEVLCFNVCHHKTQPDTCAGVLQAPEGQRRSTRARAPAPAYQDSLSDDSAMPDVDAVHTDAQGAAADADVAAAQGDQPSDKAVQAPTAAVKGKRSTRRPRGPKAPVQADAAVHVADAAGVLAAALVMLGHMLDFARETDRRQAFVYYLSCVDLLGSR